VLTIQEIAARRGLTEKISKGELEYVGPNPYELGATDDGFALMAQGRYKGCAYDRYLDRTYSSRRIAELERVPYGEYEGSLSHPAMPDATLNGAAPSPKAPSVTGGFIASPKFDNRHLKERGLNSPGSTVDPWRYFRIGYNPGTDGEKSWGPHWFFPTYHPDGREGQWRRKYQFPERQLISRPNKKPQKTNWDKSTEDKGNPVAYNLQAIKSSTKNVWLVNSELAVWLWWQEGYAAIAPLGERKKPENWCNMCREVLAKNPGAHLHVLFDNDLTGYSSSVAVWDAAHEVGLPCTVYDLSYATEKFDASDLYERCQAQEQTLGEALTSLPEATHAQIEFWRHASDKARAQRRETQLALRTEETTEQAAKSVERDGKPEKRNSAADKAEQFLDILKSNQLFFTPKGEEYISVLDEESGKPVSYLITSHDFAKWCRYVWLRDKNQVLGAETVSQIQLSLQAWCSRRGDLIESHVRSAEFGGKFYLDLCNDMGQAVELDGNGWDTIPTADTPRIPVFFRRTKGEQALPVPVRNPLGNADTWQKFRQLINVGEDANWVLYVAWLCTAILPPIFSCPILSVSGQQGSAKTWLCRLARTAIDPNESWSVPTIKEEKDVVTNSQNSRVLYLDNQTKIPEWLSNFLSAKVSGVPYTCRTLFTDMEPMIDSSQPAMIVNGIPTKLGGTDFNDRAIKLELPVLQFNPEGYKRERKIMAAFEELWPHLLAAILDAVSLGWKNRDVAEEMTAGLYMPRMADFTDWVVSLEAALTQPLENGVWEPGLFHKVYMRNIKGVAMQDATDILGLALQQLLNESPNGRIEYYGKPLYDLLFKAAVKQSMNQDEYNAASDGNPGETFAQRKIKEAAEREVRDDKSFPGGHQRLGPELKKLNPSLGKLGIHVSSNPDRNGTFYTIVDTNRILPDEAAELEEGLEQDPFADEE
jgi:hypothetical protein